MPTGDHADVRSHAFMPGRWQRADDGVHARVVNELRTERERAATTANEGSEPNLLSDVRSEPGRDLHARPREQR